VLKDSKMRETWLVPKGCGDITRLDHRRLDHHRWRRQQQSVIPWARRKREHTYSTSISEYLRPGLHHLSSYFLCKPAG
jgi:hypothetical protein